jgi:hypothetical protein
LELRIEEKHYANVLFIVSPISEVGEVADAIPEILKGYVRTRILVALVDDTILILPSFPLRVLLLVADSLVQLSKRKPRNRVSATAPLILHIVNKLLRATDRKTSGTVDGRIHERANPRKDAEQVIVSPTPALGRGKTIPVLGFIVRSLLPKIHQLPLITVPHILADAALVFALDINRTLDDNVSVNIATHFFSFSWFLSLTIV